MILRTVLIAALLLGVVSCGDDPPIVLPEFQSGPSGVWTSVSSVPVVRAHYAVCTAADGAIVAVGASGSVVVYDGAGWTSREQCHVGIPYAVWGVAQDDFYTADTNRLHHHDGTDCELVDPGQIRDIYTVWGRSSSEVYAGGTEGFVARFDGTQWTDISLGDSVIVFGIWGTAPDDLYAIDEGGNLHHYDGQTWTVVLYTTELTDEMPHKVFGASESNIMVVSGAKTHLFDGGGWSEIAPAGHPARDVCVVGENDYYAVDGESLLHCDGAAWRAIPLARRERGILNGCTVASDGSIVIVGDRGDIWRYRDDEFTLVNLATHNILGIWGSSSEDVFAVGRDGTALHFDGDSWTASDDPTFNLWDVRAVWGTGPNDVYAVWYSGLYHFDGHGWSDMEGDFDYGLEDIWGFDSGQIFAVGGWGIAYRHKGSWTKQPVSADLRSVWGSSPWDVWAVGHGNESALRFNGKEWTIHEIGTAFYARDIWGRSADEIYIACNNGVLRFDGQEWRDWDDAGTTPVTLVWGPPAGKEVYLANWSRIRCFDGENWTEYDINDVTGDLRLDVYSIWGTSSTNIYAGGENGMLLHFGPAD
jgi:hypothetical protein